MFIFRKWCRLWCSYNSYSLITHSIYIYSNFLWTANSMHICVFLYYGTFLGVWCTSIFYHWLTLPMLLIFGSTLLHYQHYIRSVPYIQEHPFKSAVHGWTFYLPYLSFHSLFYFMTATIKLLHYFWFCLCAYSKLCCTYFSYQWKMQNT